MERLLVMNPIDMTSVDDAYPARLCASAVHDRDQGATPFMTLVVCRGIDYIIAVAGLYGVKV